MPADHDGFIQGDSLQGDIELRGNVLVLTEDTDLVLAQLQGAALDVGQLLAMPLMSNISTDEIIPARCCYWYDSKLGDFAYLGLRDRKISEGAVRNFAPQVIVSGSSKGCGSSREHAVYAEKYAGVQLVFATSFERIYEQNCRNVGVITSDDFALLEALLAGRALPLRAFAERATGTERAIISLGGLFGFNRAHAQRVAPAPAQGLERAEQARPLNIVEKIIGNHLADTGAGPGTAVAAGESYFIRSDIRFSHEYVTPMAASMFLAQFGEDSVVTDPGSCYFFQDHLSLAEAVLAGRQNGESLISRVRDLNAKQRDFAIRSGGTFIGPLERGGSVAICHNYVLERLASPGNVIVGTDSHTCTAGAVGAFAFGVGSTDIANAWYNGKVLVKVPEVIRIDLSGQLRQGVCAKDIMLTLLAGQAVHTGQVLGKVLLFSGAGCAQLNIDERATMCNMAVETGAMTALFEPDERTSEFLASGPARPRSSAAVTSDPGASYSAVLALDLSQVLPMVALPGDPRNSVPLSSVAEEVPVNRTYGGSCTGGKASDMDMYASVFAVAKARGLTVADGVQAYIQMGSDLVMQYAQESGYVDLFTSVGVTVLPPSCGACINAGPGVSESDAEVTVSAQNRNFPGRSGPGQVYLTSPYVVAATAIAGRLCSVEDMKQLKGQHQLKGQR